MIPPHILTALNASFTPLPEIDKHNKLYRVWHIRDDLTVWCSLTDGALSIDRMVRTEEPARYMIDGHHVVHAETLYGSNHIEEEINKDPIRCIGEFLILRAE